MGGGGRGKEVRGAWVESACVCVCVRERERERDPGCEL